MHVRPTLSEVKAIASTGQYTVIPVSGEILSDFTTPIEVIKILKRVSSHCYLLESARADETWGRYTFLGFDPLMEITCLGEGNQIFVDGEPAAFSGHPSDFLRTVLARYRSPRMDYLPPFAGGLVGYFSYDYLGYSEPAVRTAAEDRENFRDADLMLFDKVIAFDHIRQKLILIANMAVADLEENYHKAVWAL